MLGFYELQISQSQLSILLTPEPRAPLIAWSQGNPAQPTYVNNSWASMPRVLKTAPAGTFTQWTFWGIEYWEIENDYQNKREVSLH